MRIARLPRRFRCSGAMALFLLAGVATAFAQGGSETALEAEWARLEPLSGGSLGLAAIHLETGRTAFLHPDEPYPMASTYKVPIAVELLRRVDEGEFGLDHMVDIAPDAPSDDPGNPRSIGNLMELMLQLSDNSAAGFCLRAAGGRERVLARMEELGVEGIRGTRPPYAEAPEEVRAEYESDPRDTATPRGMASLLRKIWDGEGLSPESRDLLIEMMEACATGAGRIKGRLPEGTVVAHKTGTIGRSTNDVGIVYLPTGAGHVVIVAFVKDSDLPIPGRERAIAEAARAAHDYFVR